MTLFDVYPLNDIEIIKADGCWVWDDNGNRYLDLYGGHAVISIGHSHPHYKERIKAQLDKIGFYSNSVKIPVQQELADKLGKISGRPEYQLFLCNSGAEANENAMKLASFHTGRKKILAFTGSFHGRTSLALAVTDNPAIMAPVNAGQHTVLLPFNDTAALQSYFRMHGKEVAAVIAEPIQGVGGIQIASSEFLLVIRECCDEYGALFIADEVQCGYGRSGQFFALDHAGVDADIYTMAKGMGNGFPVGGILIAPHIRPKHGMLGSTFGGNQLACAAALAVLEIIEVENLLPFAAQTGGFLMDELRKLGLPNVRGKGLMIGFDVPAANKDLRNNLLYRHRIFTGASGSATIRLLPPLSIKHEEVRFFLRELQTALSSSQLTVHN